MSREPLILGVDVGGTRMAAGLVAPDGTVVTSRSVATDRLGPDRALDNLLDLIHTVRRSAGDTARPVAGIGLGVPGVVDAEGVIGEEIQNIPALRGVALAAAVQSATGAPAVADNDVNALLLGESRFGQARGVRHVAMVAAGTGVGGALILNGDLIRGVHGYAGEIGHVTVELDGRPCSCGSRGCVKAYAAGPDIAAQARERFVRDRSPIFEALVRGDPGRIDCPAVLQAAADGDPVAVSVLNQAARALGAAAAALINLFNPEMIILGGGVIEGAPGLPDSVRRWAAFYAFDAAVRRTRIVRSSFSKESGVQGAAALFLMHRAP